MLKSIVGYNAALTPAGVELFRRPFAGSVTLRRVDWKAGAEFDITPRSMVYANVSSGFAPGGFSGGQTVLGTTLMPAAPFKETTLIAYTAGLKNRFANGNLVLNLEGFYYDYKNYQVTERDVVTLQTLIYNAAKATVYGLEMDSRLKLGRHDDLTSTGWRTF